MFKRRRFKTDFEYPRLTCAHSVTFKRRISRQILKYPRLTCARSVMFKRRMFKTDFEISEVNVCTFCNVQEAYVQDRF